MIQITDKIALNEREVQEEFIRSSGPGGQNVNKVATAVQIKFDAVNSTSLPDDIRQRLLIIAGKRINSEGMIVIVAQRFRTQKANREAALERLVKLITKAVYIPKIRYKTKPTSSSRIARLKSKHLRAQIKKQRSPIFEITE